MHLKNIESSITQKLVFICLSFVLTILLMTPISILAPNQPFPDLLTCFIFAFFISNKLNVPISGIFLVSLLADFLWFRPLGLFTFFMVLGIELIRWHLQTRNSISFLLEITYFSLFFVIISLCVSIVEFIMAIPTAHYSFSINFVIFTLLTYPATSVLVRFFHTQKRSKYES